MLVAETHLVLGSDSRVKRPPPRSHPPLGLPEPPSAPEQSRGLQYGPRVSKIRPETSDEEPEFATQLLLCQLIWRGSDPAADVTSGIPAAVPPAGAPLEAVDCARGSPNRDSAADDTYRGTLLVPKCLFCRSRAVRKSLRKPPRAVKIKGGKRLAARGGGCGVHIERFIFISIKPVFYSRERTEIKTG